MDNANNKTRWIILDRMLGQDHPVTFEDVIKEWEANGIKSQKFSNLFRQDLHTFKKLYEEYGQNVHPYESMLRQERDENDSRKNWYTYSRPNFSMKQLFMDRLSRFDWTTLDKNLDSLVSNVSPEMADKIEFFARSRLDVLRGKNHYVDWTENQGCVRGYDLAPVFYRYTRTSTPVEFIYKNIENCQKVILHPYLMKKYRNHWYCFGLNEEKNKCCHYGLDRILFGTIRPLGPESFIKYTGEKINGRITYFDNIIGVTKEYNEKSAKELMVSNKEYEIILKIHDSKVFWYFTSDPIHPSMKIKEPFDKKKQYGRVSISVITNIELYKNLLYQGPGIEVESPPFVREKMKELTAGMYRRYE